MSKRITTITDFKPGDVAGFTLAGWKHSDGTITLADSGDSISEIPKQIILNNRVYTLECIKEYAKTEKGTFVNIDYC